MRLWHMRVADKGTHAADELDNALSTPMGDNMIDDDELEAELQALEDEDIDAKLAGLDSLPAAPAKGAQFSRRAARRSRVSAVAASAGAPKMDAAAKKKAAEDAELAALE